MKRAPRNVLSLVIWAGAAVVAGALWFNLDPNRAPMPALVEAQLYRVGPIEASRLVMVYVQPGEVVKRGDAIAVLDTHALDSALAVARAEHAELLAEVETAKSAFVDDLRTRRLEIQTKLAEARANMVNAKVEQAGRKAEMGALSQRLKRLDGALQDGLVEVDRLTELRAREERLSKEVRYGPQALAAWSALDETVKEIIEAGDPKVVDQLRPIRARLETQSQRIETLLGQRVRAVLRSPVNGQVHAVLHRPGDPLVAGEPVVELIGELATQVVAYAPEEALRALTPGTRVSLAARDRSSGPASQGVVARLGPAVVELPQRLWVSPTRPVYGRPVHVELDPSHTLLPGEAASLQVVVGAQAAPAKSGPSAMTVPKALYARSRLEASGALWLADLDRFLIVSDDTGTGGDDEHQPWLFLAESNGQFDDAPVTIVGAPPVSDLEAVTLGPDGALYLLASQSRSKKGNRKAPRQQLWRVKRTGKTFELTGSVALYQTLLSGVPAPDLRGLGVGDDLDIEGLAWAKNGLLMGLKSPTQSGQAQIWLITGVDALFDGRGFAPDGAKIKEYGRVSLPTGGGDGGISDILVEGSTMYLTSTLPEGPARGAAWQVDLDLRTPPLKLADWKLKAEGLARHPDGLFVFFDTGADTPRFTRLPSVAPRP